MRTVEEIREEMNAFEGKKTTKAYRSLKEELKEAKDNLEVITESRGLGDDIAKVFKATGIDKVAKAILGDDCGCDERIKKLNQMFPRGQRMIRCFTDEEYKSYSQYMSTRNKNRWEREEITMMFELYGKIFGRTYNMKKLCGSCSGTARLIKQVQNHLDRAFENKYETLED
tara:strand:+ start:3647 stop:4159 length:513 start_codon:yes stop_codon:yes gene_type:complete